MMTPPSRRRPDDEVLVDYLLGSLSPEDTERVDELSVADDEVAWRLQAIENDLVDAYVAGRLSGARLERFTSYYLTSPVRSERVELARALRSQLVRGAARARLLPQWALAAAALIAAAGIGYFALENYRLRDQVSQANAARVADEQTVQDLRAELERERSTQDSMRHELEQRRNAPSPEPSSIQALVLLPLRRGAGDVSTVSVLEGSGSLTLWLRLEGNRFPRYQAALRDSSNGQTVWRSGPIAPRSAGANDTLVVELPVALLRSANYTLELTGSRRNDVAEFAGSYAFRVVIE